MFEKAHVGSISAIGDFQASLANFADSARQALITLDLEIRRAVDWIRVDRAQHWAHEIRRGYEAVARAKDELHRCLTFKGTEHFTPSCIDEKKALQKAQERLRHAEEKAEAVKRWTRALQHELNEYTGRLTQFHAVLDGDVPDGLAVLGRMQQILERYLTTTTPAAMSPEAIERTDSIVSMSGGEVAASMARPEGPEIIAEQQAADNSADRQAPTADLPAAQEAQP